MRKNYSQIRAMLAITRGSIRAIMRSPSTVAFSIGFPLIFILVFGFLGNNNSMSFPVAFSAHCDTSNAVYHALTGIQTVKVVAKDREEIREDLEKGRLLAVITIRKDSTTGTAADYIIDLESSEAANPQMLSLFKETILPGLINRLNEREYANVRTVAKVNPVVEKIPGRVYRSIDFILPGQLGFSLLSSGIFGVAFLFFNLRQQLVLKRFFATPIRRPYIVLGEALSRVVFQMLSVVVIVGIGAFCFHFTLVNGFSTFLEIMVLSFIALVVFLGFGFIVSSLSPTESVIPLFSNILTLPQFLLSGTFFPVDSFPAWMRPLCNILPLTHFNNAMRNISFEGINLIGCWREIGVLVIWGIIGYTIAIRVFKWE